MINFYIWAANILLIGLIRPTIQCNTTTLQGCLLDGITETTKMSLLDYPAYGYGFWFQYLSIQTTIFLNSKTSAKVEGLLILREINPDTSKYRVFFIKIGKTEMLIRKNIYISNINQKTN
ncbi:unnamed protein product (macronuclear) [Paramecium tetraurelia]|uniref:Uncharacterized protein n=1 Tax=Paramecium tetraurelia TaxID=5888 RepID=A0CFI6_PARTE|nr:uncharacterized protein GSPATT00037992001 [Paramecium tetraurelia]CAK69553.1 unnamed protein product [Paramecium tetraurelia]|eukprot:XP_001436950.1 hypothetical protein (macronuclear) [Paramecium tetraurelia strain d4-2]